MEELERKVEEPGFWDNPEESQQIMKDLKNLKELIDEIRKLYQGYEDTILLIDIDVYKRQTIAKASTEIINLQAILNLPKGTEHFLTDIHGEYEAFSHVLKNGSGSVRRKIERCV